MVLQRIALEGLGISSHLGQKLAGSGLQIVKPMGGGWGRAGKSREVAAPSPPGWKSPVSGLPGYEADREGHIPCEPVGQLSAPDADGTGGLGDGRAGEGVTRTVSCWLLQLLLGDPKAPVVTHRAGLTQHGGAGTKLPGQSP